VKKECFNDFIDHGDGKYTLFGRVLAGTPEDRADQNTRTAIIAIPPGVDIGHFVVSATFVTEDSNDVSRDKPFFPWMSERSADGITVIASRRREDANASRYVCEYIIAALKRA